MKSTFYYPEGLKNLVPDSFKCPYRCNTCTSYIEKHDSYYIIIARLCTARGCFCKEHPKNEELCFENWMLSKHLVYDRLPVFVNNCINGYRNVIYVRHIQKTIDPFFSIEQSRTSQHTIIALKKGIPFASNLYQLLTQKNKFNTQELSALSIYLRSHNLHSLSHYPIWKSDQFFLRQQHKEVINSIKQIFDYLRANSKNINSEILSLVIDSFDSEYQEYIKAN